MAALIVREQVSFLPKQIVRMIAEEISGIGNYPEEGGSRIVREMTGKMEYILLADIINDETGWRRDFAVLDALTAKHGFKWLFVGWDEEQRFVNHGVVRTEHPKVVLDYQGKYVIKPRCRLCHERTGWCRCFDTLEAAVECLEGEKHYCDDCAEMLTLERWLKGKDVINGLGSFWRCLKENGVIPHQDDDALIDPELVVKHFDAHYADWLIEESENWDCDDDSYCECPVGG